MSKVDIANKLNRTPNAIKIKANKLGLRKPEKYYYNHDFFEDINTEEKAYWLGFIYADGYIWQTDRNSELGIELQKRDFIHLKKFNKCIKGNIEVNFRNRQQQDGLNSEGTCSIRLYSRKVVNDLIQQGVKFNKSDCIGFPILNNKELMIAFIRGFFDGDGCIMRNKNRECLSANFTSASFNFIQDLRGWLYSEIGVSSYITTEKPRKGVIQSKKDCYRLYINGMENCYIFCKTLYDNAKIYLDRKYNLFYEIINEYDIVKRIECQYATKRLKHANCLSK